MRTILEHVPDFLVTLVENLRGRLWDPAFINRHRTRPEDFTRQRQLTFPVVLLFILQKTTKSLQRHSHEFLDLILGTVGQTVTAGAWSHARSKLKHTAFVELNQQIVLPLVYGGKGPQLEHWRGHRLLGLDSSVLRLPKSDELFAAFRKVEVLCQYGSTGVSYPEARISVLYDLLNRISLDARLERGDMGEVPLGVEQLAHALPEDVIVTDRGFNSYHYLATVVKQGANFITRCRHHCFIPADELFWMDRANRSVIARICAPASQHAQLQRLGLPLEMWIRFVSLRLPTGELEVLATSLLDEANYPTEEFLQVYGWRWKHETFYYMLKSRLDLENFSGQTVEAVRQDFHSTVFLCNLESMLIGPARAALTQQSANHKHRKEVNHAVAYHAIKHRVIQLLRGSEAPDQVLTQLQRLFMGAPVSQRKNRKVPRRKASLHRSYYFQRCVRKNTF